MLTTTVARGPVPTIFLAGEFDLDAADPLRQAAASVATGAEMIVLDFAAVTFIDSSGTGVFVRLCLDLAAQDIPLVARNLTPSVRAVFDMLHVKELVGSDAIVE